MELRPSSETKNKDATFFLNQTADSVTISENDLGKLIFFLTLGCRKTRQRPAAIVINIVYEGENTALL